MKRTKLLTLLLVIALVIMSAAFSACGVDLAASAGNISADNLGESSLDETADDYADDLDESSDDEEDADLEEYDAEYSDDSMDEDVSGNGEKYEIILNSNPDRMRYHLPECRGVKQISEEHYQKYELTKEEIKEKEENAGWIACGWCHPDRELGVGD